MTRGYSGFGKVVRSAREKLALSQEALAEKADLNRSFLGEIERGDVVPSLNTMAKLALALGLPLSALIAMCEKSTST